MKLRTEKPVFEIPIRDTNGVQMALVKATPMTSKETNELLLQCKKVTWERNQRFEEPDLYQYRIKKVDKVIIGWESFEDEKGNVLECNFKNKELINALYPSIIDFVLSEVEKLQDQLQKELELETKN